MISERERKLLERLVSAGKSTRLPEEEVPIAKDLERSGLLFLVGAYAVATPKARQLLAKIREQPKGTVIRAF